MTAEEPASRGKPIDMLSPAFYFLNQTTGEKSAMKKMMGLLFLLALLLCCAAARADEIVVQPDGTASLTEAVAKARPGDRNLPHCYR